VQSQVIFGFSTIPCTSSSCERKSKSKSSLDFSRRKLESLRTKKSLIPQSSSASASSKMESRFEIHEESLHEYIKTTSISQTQIRQEPSSSQLLEPFQHKSPEKRRKGNFMYDNLLLISNALLAISVVGLVGNMYGVNLPSIIDAKSFSNFIPPPLKSFQYGLSTSLTSITTMNLSTQHQDFVQSIIQYFQEKVLPMAKDSFQKMLWMEFWRRSWNFVYKKLLQKTLQVNPWESPKWLKRFPSVELFFRRGTRKLMEKDVQKKVQNGLAIVFERAAMLLFNRNRNIGISVPIPIEIIAS